jgi:predicted NBD/HSP70 family sugar kinase
VAVADLPAPHRRALAEIACRGHVSRGELGLRLDLPKATVSGIVRNLIDRGLVVSQELAVSGRPGRPAEVLTLAVRPSAIGIVCWSTGTLRLAVATPSGQILAEDTHSVSGHEVSLDNAAELLTKLAGTAGYVTADLACVVLGVPAPYQRGVGLPARPGHGFITWLRNDPAADLAAQLGTRVLIENDANLGALGEYAFGAGRDRHSFVYVKLGEYSVGAGLVLNGWLHRGVTGFAGELAHIQIDADGPLCACGGRGCLIHTIGAGLIDVAQPAYDQPLTYPAMLSLAADGDAGMTRLLRDLGRTVGRPLADACTMLNPEAIIVDGIAGAAGRPIIDGIAEAIERFAAPPAADAVQVVGGATPGDAEVLGAVALARHEVDVAAAL